MQPIDTIKAFYAALGRGDVAHVVTLLSDPLEWTEAQGFPYYSGTWRTPQEVVDKLLVPLGRDWDGFSATADSFVSQGNDAVAMGVYRGINRTTRRPLAAAFAHHWVVQGGKIARFEMFTDTLLVKQAMEFNMPTYTIHTSATAPAGSQPLIDAVKTKYGMLPNMLAGLAEAPNVLKGYLDISSNIADGTLSPAEQEIVQITTSRMNGCHYCVAAHSTIADMKKLPPDIIEALRNDTSIADAKLEALRVFAKAMVREQGWVKPSDLAAFLAAGYSKAQSLEVILSIAMKVISNYANHIMDTPVDQAFMKRAIALDLRRPAA